MFTVTNPKAPSRAALWGIVLTKDIDHAMNGYTFPIADTGYPETLKVSGDGYSEISVINSGVFNNTWIVYVDSGFTWTNAAIVSRLCEIIAKQQGM